MCYLFIHLVPKTNKIGAVLTSLLFLIDVVDIARQDGILFDYFTIMGYLAKHGDVS